MTPVSEPQSERTVAPPAPQPSLPDAPPVHAAAGRPLSAHESSVVSAPRVECWDCGVSTPIDRPFCRQCGVWLQASASSTADPSGAGDRSSRDPGSSGTVLDADSFGPLPLAIGRRSGSGGHKLAAASATILIAAVFGITAVYMGITPRGDTRTDDTAALTSGSDASGLDVDAAAPGVLDAEADLAPLAANATLTIEEPAALQEQPVELEEAPVEHPPVDVAEPLVEQPPVGQPPAEFVAPPADIVETTLEQTPVEVAPPVVEVEQPPVELEQPADPEPLPAVDSEPQLRVPGPGDGRAVKPASTVQRNNWVCEGSLSFEDPTNQRWSVSRVSFLPGNGYERVVLYMDRVGLDRGDPASVTAETYPTSRLREQFPNVARPSLGKNTVVLNLADGVTSTLGLRGYKPKGLDTLKEFSVSQSPDGSSKLTIGVAGDGCFRLRAPVWNDAAEGKTVRQIQLDVKD